MQPKDKVELGDCAVQGASSVSTLPRQSRDMSMELSNCQQKSATLSKLLKKSRDESSSSSPLRIILRDKSFPIVKPRLKILPSVGSESVNSTTLLLDNDGDSTCESPSYLQTPGYTFSHKDVSQHQETESALNTNIVKPLSNNPLPLPPRDKNAPVSVPQKRHVRKYPLIIPATGLQRTLSKVNQTTPVEEKSDVFPIPADNSNSNNNHVDLDDEDDDVFESEILKPKETAQLQDNVEASTPEKNYTKDFIENNFPSTSKHSEDLISDFPKSNLSINMNDSIISRNSSLFDEHRTYENLNMFQNQFLKDDGADGASLHFESILENNDNMIALSPIPDDMVDGFSLFNVEKETPKPSSSTVVPTLSLFKSNEKSPSKNIVPAKNINIEVKRQEFSHKFPKYKMPKNELASNALFNKIKESVEQAARGKEDDADTECDLKKSENHVSCEDLLDFSNKKPKGKERGLESDEMRILSKVLGSKVSV